LHVGEQRTVAGSASQVRQVGAQGPYLSQNDVVETFGLGAADIVDTLEVTWPTGTRDVRTAVSAGQRVTVVEGGAPTAAAPAADQPTKRATDRATDRATHRTVDRTSVQRFWALYREATARRAAGQHRAALESYVRALELDPRHEDVLYYLGGMRLELGDFAGAATAWRRLIAVNPTSARAHSRLGALHACLEPGAPFQLDSAERHLRRAHEINREENGPLLRLGELALLRGRAAEARRQFATVLATHAGSGPAHFYTGYLAWKAGDTAGAQAAFRRSYAPCARPAATAQGLGEGDTQTGRTLRPAVERRCEQLGSLTELPSLDAPAPVMSVRYQALDRLVSAASARGR
jgi:Tfp pilus assembly protein PilF